MKKNMRRLFAYVLVLALVLSNFVGFDLTAHAAGVSSVTKATVTATSVPAKNATIEVTIEGTNLPVKPEDTTKMYYQVQEFSFNEMVGRDTWQAMTDYDGLEAVCPETTGGKLTIALPENKTTNVRKLRLAFRGTDGTRYNARTSSFTQEAGDGSSTVVDKSELEKQIREADSRLQEDYTPDSWANMQAVLAEARKVEADGAASEATVKEITERLRKAIADLQPANAGMTLRVKVADKSGKPIPGVKFTFKPYVSANKEPVVEPSNAKGETTISLEGCVGMYTLVAVENEKYTFNPTKGYNYGIDQATNEVSGEMNPSFVAVEKGNTGGPQESAKLTFKAVDQTGAPIPNVEFTCENKFVQGSVVTVPATNAKGESLLSIAGLNGRYTIKAKNTADYTFQPEKGHEFMIYQDAIVGNSTFEFVGTKAGVAPEVGANKAELKAKIDEASKKDPNLYTEASYNNLKLALEEAKKVYDQADAKQEAVDAQVTKLTQAINDLKEKPQDKKNIHVKVVDEAGKPVAGIAFTFKDSSPVPQEIQVAPSNGNGETIISLAACNGRYTLNAVETSQYTFEPANGYTFMVLSGQLFGNTASSNVTFTAKKKGGPVEPGPEVPQGDVQITKVTSDLQGDIPKAGKIVNITVEGKGLTADNWSAEAIPYIEGMDIEASWMGRVGATKVTETGAELAFPSNPKTNRYDWKVTVGPLKDGKIEKHQVLTLAQEGKKLAEHLATKSVVLVDEHTLEVVFAQDIKIADEVAGNDTALKKLITIENKVKFGPDGKPNGTEVYHLRAEDTVTVEGAKLTIKFAEPMQLNNGKFTFEEGSIAFADGSKNVKGYSWMISYGAHVTGIKLDQDVFDYKGGQVVGRLQGTGLGALKMDQIELVVSDPLTTKPYDFPIEITEGEEPTIKFTVPENTTKDTQSYLLSIKVENKPVYAGTGLRGDRVIVSVFAKDVESTKQTVSSMTINDHGNSTNPDNNDPTSVELYAVPGDEGSLKCEVRLTGTNLDSKKTELRAIDENGVVFPFSHVPE